MFLKVGDCVKVVPLNMCGYVVYCNNDTYTVIVVGSTFAYSDDFNREDLAVVKCI